MLKQKILGLDISDHSIEAVVLSKSFTNTNVVAYARGLFKEEIVREGIVKKPGKLAEKIKKVLLSAKPRPIRTPYCILSIPDSQIFTAVFKLPAGLKHEEIKNTIPYKAEEVIPFKSSEIYFDFKTITVENNTQEIFYVASPKKVVDAYIEVLEAAGLIPLAFDLESISLARSLLIPKIDVKPVKKKEAGQGVLLLDIGARTTNINIFDRNGIRQNQTMKVAGNRFTKAVAQSLAITEDKAEAIKTKIGFESKGGQPKALAALQKEGQRIISEVQKILNYYYDESGSQINSVVLAGGSSLLPGIDKFFSEKLGLPVIVGNPLRKVADPTKLVRLKTKAIIFANVIGLALRGIGKKPVVSDINLLPVRKRKFSIAPERQDRKAWRWIYIRVALLVIFLAVLLGIIFLRQRGLDLYQQLYPTVDYNTNMNAEDLNTEALDQLRNQFQIPTESTSTTTEEVIEEALPPAPNLTILPTSAGYLNVRQGPGVNFAKVGQVDSGTSHISLEEQAGWYKIEFLPDQEGWVSAVYVDKLE